MTRFNSLTELGELIPWIHVGVSPLEEFAISEEEKSLYISFLSEPAQEYLKRTGQAPLYRGVKLITEE